MITMITDTIYLRAFKIIPVIVFILLILILGLLVWYNWKSIDDLLHDEPVINSVFFFVLGLLSNYTLILFSYTIKILGLKKLGYCMLRQLTIETYKKSDIEIEENTAPLYFFMKTYRLQRSSIKIKNKSYYFYYDNTWMKIKDNETISLRRVKKNNIIFYIGEE